jgi:hypothetical protein
VLGGPLAVPLVEFEVVAAPVGEVPRDAEGRDVPSVVWLPVLKLSSAISPVMVARTEKMTRFMGWPLEAE